VYLISGVITILLIRRCQLNLSELGKTIKNLRKEKSLSQEALSKESGLSRATLSKLENGYLGSVSIAVLDNILSILGYELEIKKKNPFFSP
jgi:transcriptional regulator with XRE-family HTH domain